MASCLFGEPVTDEIVRKHYPDKINITAKDRAELAFNLREADNKAVNADAYVQNLKDRYGKGMATLVTIYNATGGTLKYYKDHNYEGHIGEVPYPNEIQNGQWAAFLHVHTSGVENGSSAAVVYKGLNDAGDDCAWLNAWQNPYSGPNHVVCEPRAPSHYDAPEVWNAVEDLFKNDHYNDTWNGCYSSAAIGKNSPYKYEGTMTLEGVI